MITLLVLFAVCLVATAAHAQKFEGLAQTPPMGWNSWNHFGCNINEQIIRETADAMVESGMKESGYQYVNIDDCWQGERDERGFIQAHPDRFSSGMKALADYVHSLGLKMGIYSDAGTATCAGRPGSQGYEFQDALTYAEWGIDYLKYDWCNTGTRDAREAYTTMRNALYAAGRPVVFSICEWGHNRPWEWAEEIGHLWRTTGDIHACFDCVHELETGIEYGVLQILDMQEGLRKYAGPGRWNDPDMLQVGHLAGDHEDRAHFTMWAMLAAPLIAGNDLRNMTAETLEILTNRDVIAVNQDPLGIQGYRWRAEDGLDIWFKALSGEDWAMAVLNRNEDPQPVRLDWSTTHLNDGHSGRSVNFGQRLFSIRELWTKGNLGSTERPLLATVRGHDVLMVRLSPL